MTSRPILLDTCAAIWIESGGLSAEAEHAIGEADRSGISVLVSPITAWELGLLVSRGRLALSTDPKTWFGALIAEGIGLAPLTPEILVDSSFLPSAAFRDPVDRILAATARACGYRLMTRDSRLLEYADGGWLQAVAC